MGRQVLNKALIRNVCKSYEEHHFCNDKKILETGERSTNDGRVDVRSTGNF